MLTVMPIGECLTVSLLGMVVVLCALAILALFIIAFSKILQLVGISKPKTAAAPEPAAPVQPSAPAPVGKPAVVGTTGQVNLNNVDDKTAAMVMAVVSHETKIPLSELRFISIKAVD